MKEKEFSFEIKMDAKALYRFQIYSVYKGLQGIATIFISILCLVYLVVGWNTLNIGWKVLLIVLGLMYLLVKPISIWFKTKLLMKQDAFAKPLEYHVTEEKIFLKQAEEQAEFDWTKIWKIVVRKSDVYVYTGRMNAFIIIKEQADKAWQSFVTMAEEKGCRIA